MKTTSKILCALLVLTMVFAMFSVSASAEATQITTKDGTSITGMPADATVTYLSDGAVELVDYRTHFKGAPAKDNNENEVPVRNNESYYLNSCTTFVFIDGVRTGTDTDKDICLGYNATKYEKGLGVWAGSKKPEYEHLENYLTYAVPTGATNFYAVTGVNGGNTTKEAYGPIRFEVWGGNSKDGAFTLLAYAECATYNVAEFNVNITGYSHIKLVHYQAESATAAGGDLNAVWANAAVYSTAPAGGDTPSGGSSTTTPPKTADSFTMTAVAALVVAATSVTALVVSKKKFF